MIDIVFKYNGTLDKIIGLGKWGCLIAEELTEYPEYRIYKIDSDRYEIIVNIYIYFIMYFIKKCFAKFIKINI